MALIAGVDRSYFGKLERGERQPSLSMLLRIAEALGVSGAELVKRTESAMSRNGKRPANNRNMERGAEVLAEDAIAGLRQAMAGQFVSDEELDRALGVKPAR